MSRVVLFSACVDVAKQALDVLIHSRSFVWCVCVFFFFLQISCSTNTPIEISGGASVEMISSEPFTKINNVKIWLREGTFLCTVPKLDWTSVETKAVRF